MINICKNFRPPIIKNTPKGYVELMQKCWDPDPNKRPMASNIYEELINIYGVELKNPTDIIKSSDTGPIITNNSDKSRPLSGMIKCAESIRTSESQPITLKLGK